MFRNKAIIFFIVLFLFILTYSSMANGYDYDFWARLIVGMSVVQSGIVLKQDFLSYTPTHTWYDHEWGSGVVFYIIQHFFNSTGILLAQALFVLLIFFLITKVINLRGLKTTSAYNFLFYFVAFHAMSININSPIRCQIFSYIFFTLFIYILELARRGNNKGLWSIPFIMVIWNNLHGGCVSGIGLLGIYIVGEFLNKAPVKKYIFTLIPTLLVLPLNPWGLDYMKFLLHATTMPRPYIIEWWGMFSSYYLKKLYLTKFFMLSVVFTELAFCAKKFSFKTFDKTKFLILLATVFLAIEHVKMIPFFVITASCFVYDDFYTLINTLCQKLKSVFKIKPELFGQWFLKTKEFAVYSIILIFALVNLKAKSFAPMVTTTKYPLREVEFIKINKIKGNLFCNFGLGSYVSYKLYPHNKIFMDGRYEEVYDDELMLIMRAFLIQNKDSQLLLEKYPPEIILIEKFYPAYEKMIKTKDWVLAFEGEHFGVFLNEKTAKTNYIQPSDKIQYYKDTHFKTDIKFEKSS